MDTAPDILHWLQKHMRRLVDSWIRIQIGEHVWREARSVRGEGCALNVTFAVSPCLGYHGVDNSVLWPKRTILWTLWHC